MKLHFPNLLVVSMACLPGLTVGQRPIDVIPVEYADTYDNDFALLGYVSIPDSDTPVPGVVIIVSSI
jgi:hypothetical protein